MNSSNVRDFSRANSDQQITALLPFEAFAISKANRPLNFQMIGYFGQLIEQDPTNAYAYYFRGLAHLAKGNPEGAVVDMEKISDSDLTVDAWDEVRLNRGYARFKAGLIGKTFHIAEKQLRENPLNALANAYYGEYLTVRGQPELGLSYLEKAILLDPNLGLAHLLRAEILVSRGSKTAAKEALHLSDGLNLPTYQNYVERANLYASFGEFDLAFSDLREALQINPDQADAHYDKAVAHDEASPSLEGHLGLFVDSHQTLLCVPQRRRRERSESAYEPQAFYIAPEIRMMQLPDPSLVWEDSSRQLSGECEADRGPPASDFILPHGQKARSPIFRSRE